VADSDNAFVVGKFNTLQVPGLLFAVGNGASTSSRANAFTVTSDNNAILAGDLTANGVPLAATLNTLLGTIATLQQQVNLLQAQVDQLMAE
jgi:hypothetical protein